MDNNELTAIKKPSNQWFLQQHKIEIEFLSRGCIIKIGCKSIPFVHVDEAMAELNDYVKNPHEAEIKWSKILP